MMALDTPPQESSVSHEQPAASRENVGLDISLRAGPRPTALSFTIEVERLIKSFAVRPILRNVTFAVEAGRSLALLGPNGAGKTTLLRILATLAKPTHGRVVVAGHDVAVEANEARRQIGYVGHQLSLYEDMTAHENLLFYAKMYGLRDGAVRSGAWLARVGLQSRANDRVRNFSRGQAQRLALARGVLHEPAVLLLDEPDTGLDEQAIALLGELLAERRQRGATTVLTTHNLERGLALTDDTMVLLGGRVARISPSASLTADDVRELYRGREQAGGRP